MEKVNKIMESRTFQSIIGSSMLIMVSIIGYFMVTKFDQTELELEKAREQDRAILVTQTEILSTQSRLITLIEGGREVAADKIKELKEIQHEVHLLQDQLERIHFRVERLENSK